MSRGQTVIKRVVDVCGAMLGLALTGWIILLGWVAARLSTGDTGFFRQVRIGRHGEPFEVLKLRTMVSGADTGGPVTVASDPRVTGVGRVLRRFRIDELPQLWNVLLGEMSLVGPRPDVPGFADRLEGPDREILEVRPGVTGPATLAFRDEATMLARQDDPDGWNRTVLFPAKVRINLRYVREYSILKDVKYIAMTVLGMSIDPRPYVRDSTRA